MNALRPFCLLLGRASVFWLGAFGVFTGAMIVLAVDRVVEENARTGLYVDATFIATLWFPAAAGWLVGLVIQEFQHTSFAHPLPGVRSRIAAGYLGTGVVVTALVAVSIARASTTSPGLPLTFALGLGAYCVGGALQDPLSGWITLMNTVLAVLVFARSSDLARLTAEHPWIAGAVSAGVGAVGLHRLFARSTFRRKPFRLTKPIPGSFSLQRTDRYERQRRLEDRSRISDWRSGSIGSGPWAWVRAAFHETHGALGWRTVTVALGRAWGVGLLVLIYAWVDKGDLGFGEALARSLFDALFRSPHQAQFGEKGGPYLMIMILIAALGIVTALLKGVQLTGTMAYPLSRLQRARVAFRAGLVDMAILVAILGAGLYAVGHLMGLVAGYEPRFDFMPFHLRVLLVTLVLMPLGYRGRILLQAATRRKAGNLVVGVGFGVTAFVIVAAIGVYLCPLLFGTPLQEWIALVVALLTSLLIHRRQLRRYYRTADLA